jgi:hypothetical protein
MNRIKFLSKVTYMVSISLALALTLSCSSNDDKDNSPSVIFACNDAYYGFCMEYTKFKNEAAKIEEKDDCEEENGSIVSKCSRDGVKLECPLPPEDGTEGNILVYNGVFWQENGGIKCNEIYRLLRDED